MSAPDPYGHDHRAETAGKPAPTEHVRQMAEGQDEFPEETLWEGGYSAADMYGWWVICGVITVVAILVCVLVPGLAINPIAWAVAGGIVGLCWGYGLWVLAARKLGVAYKLTTQRFIHQHGILTRVTDRIEVIDIDDVSYRQGLFERMFGVGTVTLVSSDKSHPTLVLHGVTPVAEIADKIDDVRRKERRRRGLHIAG
jgi:membrane protein YdbS with pleckstrin-like domain